MVAGLCVGTSVVFGSGQDAQQRMPSLHPPHAWCRAVNARTLVGVGKEALAWPGVSAVKGLISCKHPSGAGRPHPPLACSGRSD